MIIVACIIIIIIDTESHVTQLSLTHLWTI